METKAFSSYYTILRYHSAPVDFDTLEEAVGFAQGCGDFDNMLLPSTCEFQPHELVEMMDQNEMECFDDGMPVIVSTFLGDYKVQKMDTGFDYEIAVTSYHLS